MRGGRSPFAVGVAVAVVFATTCGGARRGTPSAGRLRPAVPPSLSCEPSASPQLLPPRHGMLSAAYANGLGASPDVYRKFLELYSRATRKRPAVANVPITIEDLSSARDMRFPDAAVRAVWSTGAVPMLGFTMPVTGDELFGETPEQRLAASGGRFLLQRFLDGEFDEQITRWALDAKATGIPLLVSFGGEVTAGWPWSAAENGAGEARGYGDPGYPDGPERYRDAHRRVVDRFRAAGADNVSWVFGGAPQAEGAGEPWNDLSLYYPGDAYVDWLFAGAWGYYPPFVTQHFDFAAAMDGLYKGLTALSKHKPIGIEMGYAAGADEQKQKAKWIKDAYTALASGRWPNVKMISYWHENSPSGNDQKVVTAVDSSREVKTAARAALADPFFKDTPTIACQAPGHS